jgi:gamma-glutamyl-gamma-aminobutyrate hydrolase PuuD
MEVTMFRRIFFISLLILLISATAVMAGRPVLVVSHAYTSVMENILYLQDNNHLVATDFIFLLHESETKIKDELKELMSNHPAHKFHFEILKGLPSLKNFNKIVRDSKRYPVATVPRMRLTGKEKIPASWNKTFRRIFAASDGYLIPGGADLPSSLYDEKQFVETYAGGTLRASYETPWIRFLIDAKKGAIKERPTYFMIGICLGCQMMNVATGGAMVQSIPLEIYKEYYAEDLLKMDPDNIHKNYWLTLYPGVEREYPGWFHRLRFQGHNNPWFPASDSVYVLSNHHQAVKRAGESLAQYASSVDGKIPEIFHHRNYPNVIAVQFHPEKKFCFDRLKNYPPETLAFHKNLWGRAGRVLKQNRIKRLLKK